MANSDIITSLKTNVIQAICQDPDFFEFIDPPRDLCENGGDLPGKCIFTYNKNPETITETMTFLTIMVHTNYRDRNKTYLTPILEIWIYSRYDHMDMHIKGIKDNRNDYLSKLLDYKFNGSTQYGGIGQLRLTNNLEGTFGQKHLYRKLLFETVDINNSFCEVDYAR